MIGLLAGSLLCALPLTGYAEEAETAASEAASESETGASETASESESGANVQDFEKTQLKAKVGELESEKAALQASISQLESEKAALEQQVADLQATNASLQASLDAQAQTPESTAETTAETESETGETQTGESNPGQMSANGEYHDRAVVRLVQQTLNNLGFDCGTPDGLAGSKTVNAIVAYQTQQGLPTDGIVTDALLQSMGIQDQLDALLEREASKEQYSTDYTYEQLITDPESYIGYKVRFTGTVLEVATGSTSYLRLGVNGDANTSIFVTYEADAIAQEVPQYATVTVYGMAFSTYSYEIPDYGAATLPWIMADIVDLA